MKTYPRLGFSFALCAVLPAVAHASVGDRFGYLSSSSAVAGARAGAGEFTSASAYENPSQLSLLKSNAAAPEGSRVRFHWSMLYANPKFADIHGVAVENAVNSDTSAGSEELRNVDTNYASTFGQSVGFSIQSHRSERRWGIGAVAYLPLDRLALVDSGESFVPEYTLHRASTQKPEFQLALSGRATEKLSFGAGLHLGAKLTANTAIFLNQGTGTTSSMRISASLKTRATPYFGVTYLPTENLSLGLNYRFAASQPQSMKVHATARAIGTVSALDFAFPALATMYYDPATLEFGGRWSYASGRSLSFEIDYQAWSKFESPAMVILDPATSECSPNCGVDFAAGRNLAPKTRDLFIPRLGHTWAIGDAELNAGYLYRPGIYAELPTGAGNAIDPDEHRVAAGYGRGFDSFFAFDAPGRIDFHLSYSIYPKKRVVKTAGDENGNAAGRKIGSPGYEIGGSEAGGGLSLQLFL
jgi:long-subunit fatty acid transport protein